jgi:hypothetical protein
VLPAASSDIIPSLRVDSPDLDLRELTPDLGPAVEKLFGSQGACGASKSLLKRGKVHEILAFHGGHQAAAEKAFSARGAEVAEAHPVKAAHRTPAALASSGVTSMFEACGFAVAEARPKGKQRYRKVLQTARLRRRGVLRD